MLRIVGAGLPRTGTESLKIALERLFGAPCYHMLEVFRHPEHVPLWHAALKGERPRWDEIFAGYDTAVDWPASAFWRELSSANPNAVVVLSTRTDAETWWRSVSKTVAVAVLGPPRPDGEEWHAMVTDLLRLRFDGGWSDPEKAMAGYERNNAEVRATVPPERLVDWRAGDGWAPLCEALGIEIPDEPFPHANSTADFRARAGFDEPAAR